MNEKVSAPDPSRAGALLSARDLRKSYRLGTHVVGVLAGASIDIAPGETVSIVGVSGAGKSTLLHILGGLDRPDSGVVLFDGKPLYDEPAGRTPHGSSLVRRAGLARARTLFRAKDVGFVFQSYHLLPELDVLENTALPARAAAARRISRSETNERAMALLKKVGLAERARHTPLELSGGEQQRLALARSLINEPALVLADEPTGNLDDVTGGGVLDCLFGMSHDRKCALLIVTHNEKVASMCDRVYRLADGVLTRMRPLQEAQAF